MESVKAPDAVSHETLLMHLDARLAGRRLSLKTRLENAWYRLPPGHPMKGDD